MQAHHRHLKFVSVEQASFFCALATFVMAMLSFGWHALEILVVGVRRIAMLACEMHALGNWPLKHAIVEWLEVGVEASMKTAEPQY